MHKLFRITLIMVAVGITLVTAKLCRSTDSLKTGYTVHVGAGEYPTT